MDEIGPQEIEEARKIVEASVTPEAAVEEFGDQHFHKDEKGWRLDLKDERGRVDKKKLRTFNEMDRKRREHAAESAARREASISQVTIKGPDGRRMKVDERHAERIERSLWEKRR